MRAMTTAEPEDFRLFVSQLMARSDRMLREVLEETRRGHRELLERMDRKLEASEHRLREIEAHAAEQRAEHRAMVDALMRMLDRLPPRDGGAAA
jgi:Skp family chaperone for outer membrane proteins